MKKLFFCLFLVFILIILVGCGNNTNQPSEDDYSDDQRYDIYKLAQTSGYTGTYEQWLASIKGDVIVIKVDSNGNLVWKYKTEDDENYRVLYNLSSLKGADGKDGKDGEDGHSPEVKIGANGNWFVDGVDTGVKAQGEKGEDGQNGQNGQNGENGKSAYDLAVENGYTGTLEQWILSLAGKEVVLKVTANKLMWKYSNEADSKYRVLYDLSTLKGKDGAQGQPGATGATGNGILAIKLLESNGLEDIYEIQFTNGTSTTFSIMNGHDGENGQNGHSPEITIGGNGNWFVDGVDTGKRAEAIQYIPVVFNNYDGSLLYTFYFEKGSSAVYDGAEPIKPSEVIDELTATYTFIGWDKSLDNIQEPTIYTAQFESSIVSVTFVNYDGTLLYETKVERGHDVEYVASTPTRTNPALDWQFTGWDKPLTNILADTTFTAQFYAPNSIECIFKNYDGTVLNTQYVGNGDTVVYEGDTPTKPDDNIDGIIIKYEFIGWDNKLTNITQDTVFTAQYGSTIYYEVQFVDHDDVLLYTTSTFGGGQVSYVGDTPTRPLDVDGTSITKYTFTGWDKSLANISEPTIIKAQYSSHTFTGYKVTFLDSDDTELYSYYCEENTDALYPYESPWRYDNENVYMFLGWSVSFENITSSVTTKASYLVIPREKNGEYPQAKVDNENIINALSQLTTTNSKGYYEYNGEQYAELNDNYYLVEPIKWKYLDGVDSKVLVVSELILDAHRYNEYYSEINDQGDYPSNYKNSEIRAWLNNEFINQAFDDQSLIVTTAVDNSVASTGLSENQYVCETTYDKIFLLSVADCADYGLSAYKDEYVHIQKFCKVTDYAVARGTYNYYIDEYGDSGFYWTRSPNGYGAFYVNIFGTISSSRVDYISSSHIYYQGGVRVALWFDLGE